MLDSTIETLYKGRFSYQKGNSERDASFRRNWLANEENIRVVSEARQNAERHNDHDWVVMLNVNLFVSLCNYDLSLLHYDLCSMEPGWKKDLQARLAALLIVEYMEDIAELMGKEFRDSINSIITSEHDKEQFKEVGKGLSRLRKQHEKDLRTIRNLAIAHREKNAKVQLASIQSVDAEQVNTILLAMIEWQTSIFNFLTHLTNLRTFALKDDKI